MSDPKIIRLPIAESRSPDPDRPSESDMAAAVGACGRGDAEALGVLYDQFGRGVHRYLLRLAGGRSRSDVEDLVHETFIAVFRAAPRFAHRSSVRTWILGIATNVHRRHARGLFRRKRLRAAVAVEPVQRTQSIDATVERRARIERLNAALGDLTDKLRTVVVLCEIEEVPCTEAAVVLGIPVGTVYRRLHDARRRLQRAMEESS